MNPGRFNHHFYLAPEFYIAGLSDIQGWAYRNSSVSELMLEFRQGSSWEHRAYWGANSINRGTNGTNSRRYIGALPSAGSWQPLTIDATLVGLDDTYIHGIKFTQYNGLSSFDEVINWRRAYYWQKESSADPEEKPSLSVTYWLPSIGEEEYKRYQELGGQTDQASLKVDLSNGNLLFAQRDIEIPGRGIPTAFSHVYNSQADTDSAYGYNWSLQPLMKLSEDANGNVTVVEGDGSRHTWIKNGAGYDHPPGIYRELTKDGSTYELYDMATDVTWGFDSGGKATEATDADGNTSTYLYGSGKLTGIRDAAGRQTTLTYNGNGRLAKLDWSMGLAKQEITQNAQNSTWSFGTNPFKVRQSFTITQPMRIKAVDLYLAEPIGGGAELQVGIFAEGGTVYLTGTTLVSPAGGYGGEPVTVDLPDIELAPGVYQLVAQAPGYYSIGYQNSNVYSGGSAQTYNYSTKQWADYPSYDLYFILRHGELRATYSYDGSGNLTSIVNANEETTTFSYDANHRMTAIANPEGGVTSITPTGSGQTSAVTLPTTSTATFSFAYSGASQTASAETTVTDPRGYSTKYRFNKQALCTKITDPLGATPDPSTPETDFPNDEAVEASAVAAYDSYFAQMVAQGKLTANEQAVSTRTPSVDGTVTNFEYDDNFNITKQTDKDGLSESWTFDEDGNVLTETNRAGLTTTYTYTDDGNEDTETSPEGAVTDYDYDQEGHLICETDAEGNKTTYEYNAYGDQVGQVSPRGNTPGADPSDFDTTMTVDSVGNVIKVEKPVVHNPDGTSVQSTTETTYSVTGQPLIQKDPYGNATYLGYDGAGRQTFASSPTQVDGSSTITRLRNTKDYDSNGNPTREEALDQSPDLPQIFGSVKSRTDHTYNGGGQLTSQVVWADDTEPWNVATTTYSYDAAGNKTAETNPLGGTTTYQYDGLDRLTKESRPDGSHSAIKYDAVGNAVKVGSAQGTAANIHGVDHDLLSSANKLGFGGKVIADGDGRRTKVADRAGTTTETTYDAIGTVNWVDEPTGARTAWEQDEEANETRVRFNSQDQGIETSTGTTYNEANLPATHIDQQGEAAASAYDSSIRLKTLLQPNDANQEITYTASGATGKIDATGSIINSADVTLQTDALGSVTHELSVDASTGALETSVSSTFNDARQLTARTDGLGVTVSFAYNDANNITGVTDSITGSNGAIGYEYDAASRMTSASFDNTQVAIGYDEGDRVEEISALGGNLTATMDYDAVGRTLAYVNRFGETTLSAYSYLYNNRGDITSATEGTASLSFGYDSLGRLTGAARPGSSVTYTYDNLGNRLMKADSSAQTTVTYSYNDANELTSEIRSGESLTYLYDANGNLVSAISNPYGTTTYAYDNKNQLVKVTKPDQTVVEYFYDSSGNRIEKRVDGVPRYYQYDSHDNLVLETDATKSILVKYVRDKEGRALAMKQNGAIYYFLYNGHGDVTGIVNSGGSLVATYEYDEFGNLLSSSGAIYNPMRYAAAHNAYFDTETGLYRMGERYYWPSAGRWTTRDRADALVGEPATYQEYVYVENGPLVGVDPSGRTVKKLGASMYSFNRLGDKWCWAACDRMVLVYWRKPRGESSPRQLQIVNWAKDQGLAARPMGGLDNLYHEPEESHTKVLNHWGIHSRAVASKLAWAGVKNNIGQRKSPIIAITRRSGVAEGSDKVVWRYRELKRHGRITHRSVTSNTPAWWTVEEGGKSVNTSYASFDNDWRASVDHMWVR